MASVHTDTGRGMHTPPGRHRPVFPKPAHGTFYCRTAEGPTASLQEGGLPAQMQEQLQPGNTQQVSIRRKDLVTHMACSTAAPALWKASGSAPPGLQILLAWPLYHKEHFCHMAETRTLPGRPRHVRKPTGTKLARWRQGTGRRFLEAPAPAAASQSLPPWRSAGGDLVDIS